MQVIERNSGFSDGISALICEVDDLVVIIDIHFPFTFATQLLNPMSSSM